MNRITLANINARNAAPLVGSYICDGDVCPHAVPERSMIHARLAVPGHGHCWHRSTARRLEWQGGPSANAAADLAAWNGLGKKRGAA